MTKILNAKYFGILIELSNRMQYAGTNIYLNYSHFIIRVSHMYTLKKSRQILKLAYTSYQKKRKELTPDQLNRFESQMESLDAMLLKGDREESDRLARQVEEFTGAHFKKSFVNYFIEMAGAILIALAVATVVRQTWFELYEIPTGSMRPTFKEQDHLTVTKTAFGLNVPLQTRHFYFDPYLVQRLSVVIWSGDGIPHLNSDSTFMGIFPYTKRYIKRCMGKPGDTLYFYGGKIFGFDREGNDLPELRDNSWTARIESIPFTNFQGRSTFAENRKLGNQPEAIFHHFNQAIGRLRFNQQEIKGQIYNGSQWVEDKPEAQREPHKTIQTYSDFWGIRNFALARLLNKDQLESLTSYRAKDLEEGVLYLELRHTPSLNYPLPILSNRFGVAIKGYSTVIPLQEKHLKALMENMYTCRFVVKDGRATSYRQEGEKFHATTPQFPSVPNGTYEFYYGKAVKVGWGGTTSSLPVDHPLYHFDPKNIQRLYNTGIEMTTIVEPSNRDQPFFPNRYVYFREGALYTMGGVLMEKEDPLLATFKTREDKKQKASTSKSPYVAFKDYGPPLNSEGKLDRGFIETFGYKVPEGHYLMLGDNHAMSQDCRYFGPIPQDNLQGAPSLIIWPPGDRWGFPNQKPYPLITVPRLIVWSIAGLIGLIWFIIYRRSLKRSIFKKL